MTDRKIYQQQKQAQLDRWKAELDVLKAKVSELNADARHEANQRILALEHKIEEIKAKLVELAKAGDDTWESIRDGLESAWGALKSAVQEVSSKLTSGSKPQKKTASSESVSSGR